MAIRQEVVEGDSTPIKITFRHSETKQLIDLTGTTNHALGWKNRTTAATGTVGLSVVAPPTSGVLAGSWDPAVTISSQRNLLDVELHYKDSLGDNHTSHIGAVAIRKRLV